MTKEFSNFIEEIKNSIPEVIGATDVVFEYKEAYNYATWQICFSDMRGYTTIVLSATERNTSSYMSRPVTAYEIIVTLHDSSDEEQIRVFSVNAGSCVERFINLAKAFADVYN
jgi:hypothetical protein